MAIFLENILDVHYLKAISEALSDEAVFKDGRATAAGLAKTVKFNLQADPGVPAVKGCLTMVEKALFANSLFKSAAVPYKLSKLMFSRYAPGMEYGAHVDEAFIAGVRTDLSFTLFLSDPEFYDGGELIVKRNDGDEVIKLPAGSLYLYPANSLHFVAPVTKGIRIAAVGWVQSRIRLEEHRTILFDLTTALNQLPKTDENKQIRLKLLNAKNNLLRLWAD